MERIAISLPDEFLKCQVRSYGLLQDKTHGLSFILEIPEVTEEMKDQANRMNLSIIPAEDTLFRELTADRLIDFTKNYLATEKQELVEVFFNMLEQDYNTLDIANNCKLTKRIRKNKSS
ncbi:hypothetical protein [Ewingella americana]|uniref:Uncharacterized protein n=1 Tax=Ewingella americana TaxID=41202 RepID=A0A502GCZ8_9GAMM|nr:hypothetical protein [Ewingella americana]TPG60147.1 hypothetical protein EAH77_16390 [Ewingella americana]